MSGQSLPLETGRWPQSGPGVRSPYRAILWFWAMLAGCGASGAIVLQLLGPPPPAGAGQPPSEVAPAAALTPPATLPQETAPKPVDTPTAELATSPEGPLANDPAMVPSATSSVPAAPNIPSARRPEPPAATAPAMISPGLSAAAPPVTEAEPFRVAPPQANSPEPSLVTRPSPHQTVARPRPRPAADPIEAALNRLRRHEAPPRDAARLVSPLAVAPDRHLEAPAVDHQDSLPDPTPWQPEPDRDARLASEPGASFPPEPPPQDLAAAASLLQSISVFGRLLSPLTEFCLSRVPKRAPRQNTGC